MYTQPIHHLIRLKRQALNMSQAALAEYLLMDGRTLRRKESGQLKVHPKQDHEINKLLLTSDRAPDKSGQDIATLRTKLGWTISDAAEKFYLLPDEWEALERSQHAPEALLKFLSLAHLHADPTGHIPFPQTDDPRASEHPSRPSEAEAPRAKPEHLKLLRKTFGLNQAQLAVLLGVSRATVNRYESGEYVIPRHMLITLRGVAATLKERRFNQDED